MKWIDYEVLKPKHGERVLITFKENHGRIRVCYFDSKETFAARTEEVVRERLPDDYRDGWFTEADDSTDWWEAKYISYWAPIPALPKH